MSYREILDTVNRIPDVIEMFLLFIDTSLSSEDNEVIFTVVQLNSTQLYLTLGYICNTRAYKQKQNMQMKDVVTKRGKHITNIQFQCS